MKIIGETISFFSVTNNFSPEFQFEQQNVLNYGQKAKQLLLDLAW